MANRSEAASSSELLKQVLDSMKDGRTAANNAEFNAAMADLFRPWESVEEYEVDLRVTTVRIGFDDVNGNRAKSLTYKVGDNVRLTKMVDTIVAACDHRAQPRIGAVSITARNRDGLNLAQVVKAAHVNYMGWLHTMAALVRKEGI